MHPREPTQQAEADSEEIRASLAELLRQEEVALGELESLIAGERMSLVSDEPAQVLAVLEQAEEALGRIEQLVATRAGLAIPFGACVNGIHDAGHLIAPGVDEIATPGRLLNTRHHILGAIARIAWQNEANGQFIAGLSRSVEATIQRVSQLQAEDAAGPPSISRRGVTPKKAAKLDVLA